MSFATKRNRGGIDWGVNTKDYPYVTMNELAEKHPDDIWTVRGVYINNKSKYGPAPCLISDGLVLNLPRHMLQTVEEILKDAQDIADIKAGRVLFRLRPYQLDGDSRTFYSIEWLDAAASPEMAYTE